MSFKEEYSALRYGPVWIRAWEVGEELRYRTATTKSITKETTFQQTFSKYMQRVKKKKKKRVGRAR